MANEHPILLLLSNRPLLNLHKDAITRMQYDPWLPRSIECLERDFGAQLVIPQYGREHSLHLHHGKLLADTVPEDFTQMKQSQQLLP